MKQENKPSRNYMNLKQLFSLSFLAALSLISVSPAQVDLNLEELMSLSTSVADKIDQPILDAPGFISVYSQDHIQKYGTYSIEQLVAMTTGYSVVHNFGEPGLMTRGVTSGGWNNNSHLMLIDGIPFRMTRSNKAYINHAIPLHFAQQVEILRGSASALYGVGAYAGVIQISPITPAIGESEQFIRGGYQSDFKSKFIQAYSSNSGEYGTTTLAYGAYSNNGILTDLRAPVKTSGLNFERKYLNQENSKFFYTSHDFNEGWLESLKAGLIYAQSEGGIGEFWGEANYQPNSVLWETYSPYLKYSLELPNRLTNYSYVAFNRSQETGTFIGTSFDETQGEIIGNSYSNYSEPVEAWDLSNELHLDINDHSKLIAGVNYYQVQAMGHEGGAEGWQLDSVLIKNKALYKPSEISKTISGYLQATSRINFLDGLLLTAGARLDNGMYADRNYQQLSPRVSLVQKITPHLNFKALYSTALKAPGVKEIRLNEEAVVALESHKDMIDARPGYDPKVEDIGAETIETSEIGLAMNGSLIEVSANLFINSTQNPHIGYNIHENQPDQNELAILEQNDPANDTLYLTLDNINANKNGNGQYRTNGLEIESVIKLNSLRIFTNYTMTQINQSSTYSSNNVPSHQVKAGATHTVNSRYPTQISTWGNYTHSLQSMHDGSRKISESYSFSELNMNIRQSIYPTTWVELKVTNILDEQSPAPTYNDDEEVRAYEGGLDIPRASRKFSLAITSNF